MTKLSGAPEPKLTHWEDNPHVKSIMLANRQLTAENERLRTSVTTALDRAHDLEAELIQRTGGGTIDSDPSR